MNEERAHYANTEASDQTYQVFFNQALILESSQAIKLDEHYDGKDFASVIYFPESVLSELGVTRSDLTTHCPIKGDASYLNYRDIANSIWCYQDPYPQVDQIRNHYAFDQSKGFRISVGS
jgi:uncharacterized protein (DUF427 family)